jgi:anti-anti-sigma factor
MKFFSHSTVGLLPEFESPSPMGKGIRARILQAQRLGRQVHVFLENARIFEKDGASKPCFMVTYVENSTPSVLSIEDVSGLESLGGIHMTLATEWIGGVAVLTLEGKLTVDHEASRLTSTVRALADEGRSAVVLDLGGVDYADSLGLEAIVASHISLTKRGGRLVIGGLSPRLRHLLDLTRLSSVLEIHPDRAHALESLTGDR